MLFEKQYTWGEAKLFSKYKNYTKGDGIVFDDVAKMVLNDSEYT